MILIIILTIIGVIVYAVIGNVLMRWLDSIDLINVDIEYAGTEATFFILGIAFPLILLFILIQEISLFIFNKLKSN